MKIKPHFTSQNRDWRTILVLCGAILVFGVSLLFLIQSIKNSCENIETVNMSISVVGGERKSIGFNTDRDSLKFGKISPGAEVRRVVYINYTQTSEVKVYLEGGFVYWVNVSPQLFSVQPFQKQDIVFTVTIPESAKVGEYTGKAHFCFKR